MIDFIPIQYYQLIYYNIILLFVIVFVFIMNSKKINNISSACNSRFSLSLFFIVLIFIGLRPISTIFPDMVVYDDMFVVTQIDKLGKEAGDILFKYYIVLCRIFMGSASWFFLTALIYIGFIYKSCKILFGRLSFIGFLMFVTSFSFFAYGVGVIRAGMATSIIVLAISYSHKLKYMIPLLIISIGIHKSMILPIGAFVLTNFYKNTKIYFGGWICCIFLSAILGSYFENIFLSLGFNEDRLSGYFLAEDTGYKSGFRWDFLIYSALPILWGLFFMVKKNIEEPYYSHILNTYIVSNAFWVLIIRADFSDRFAYLSWFLMPLVLIYPLLKFRIWKNQNQKISLVVVLNFLFTYFMSIIR